jgi:hypothetical protein
MMLTSVIGTMSLSPTSTIKRQIKRYLRANDLETVAIRNIRTKDRKTYTVEIALPYTITHEGFQKHLPGLEQTVAAPIRYRQVYGATCELDLGYHPFHDKMMYIPPDKPDGKLQILLYTAFGPKYLDFRDETSCHLLGGGATRMGKSVFIRLTVTHLMLSTEGKIQIFIANNKITDLHMFRSIPQITCAETAEEANKVADDVMRLLEERKKLLKDHGDVADVNGLRKKCPDIDLPPIFFIVDEYGRFADDKKFQEKVIFLAETAGYLDVHIILASQRPDGKDVLKPRIKANLMTRICFKTANEANSNIVLDLPDAAQLPMIQGRAIMLDGFPEQVQVPYVSELTAVQLLKPFKVKEDEHVKPERPEGSKDAEALPNFVTDTLGEDNLPGSSPSGNDGKPGNEKAGKGRVRSKRSAAKGPTLSLHAESSANSPSLDKGRTLPWRS